MSIPSAYLGVILIWSTTPLAIKWSGESVGFVFGVSTRMLLGTVLCLLLLWLMRVPLPWHRKARQTYLAAASGIFAAMTFVYWGAQYVPSGLISVLFGLAPLLTAVLAFFLLGERHLSPVKMTGIVLGVFGLGVIFQESLVQTEQFKGLLLVLASVLVHVLSAIWVKRVNAQIPAMAMTAGALLYALPAYLLLWLFAGDPAPLHVPQKALVSILYLGVFGSVLGFIMYFYILKHVDATRVALLTLITPVLALLLGRFLNDETISAWVAMGVALILLGMGLFQWGHLIRRQGRLRADRHAP